MKILMMGRTQLTEAFKQHLITEMGSHGFMDIYNETTDGALIALSAIRTCYSHLQPHQVLPAEGKKYFKRKATDGGKGSDADRLIRHIMTSKHTSTLEHVSFTFSVVEFSRAMLAQITRHRTGTGFSVQSQRYVRLGSNDKSGGFDYVVPETIHEATPEYDVFQDAMDLLQVAYDNLRALKVPAEDARAVLPNAAIANMTFSINLRAALDIYGKRMKGNGAQAEIADFVDQIKDQIVAVEPWTEGLFQIVAGVDKEAEDTGN